LREQKAVIFYWHCCFFFRSNGYSQNFDT